MAYEIVRLTATILLYREIEPIVEGALSPDFAEIVKQSIGLLIASAVVLIGTELGLSRPDLRLIWWEQGSRSALASNEVRLVSGPKAVPRQWEVYADYRHPSLLSHLATRVLRSAGTTIVLGVKTGSTVRFTVERSMKGSGVNPTASGVEFPVSVSLPDGGREEMGDAAPTSVAWGVVGMEAITDPGNLALKLKVSVTLGADTLRARLAARYLRLSTSVERVRLERS